MEDGPLRSTVRMGHAAALPGALVRNYVVVGLADGPECLMKS